MNGIDPSGVCQYFIFLEAYFSYKDLILTIQELRCIFLYLQLWFYKWKLQTSVQDSWLVAICSKRKHWNLFESVMCKLMLFIETLIFLFFLNTNAKKHIENPSKALLLCHISPYPLTLNEKKILFKSMPNKFFRFSGHFHSAI